MIHDPDCTVFGRAPGLPDDLFEHDGLITKRHIRATAVGHLRPLPGQLLWDVGTGAGSIAIEWCRGADGARAIGLERNPTRAGRARANAARLTPAGSLEVREGPAAEALDSLPAPDAVFVGGGLSSAVLDRAVARIRPGGRIVAHGVTVEAELVCAQAHSRWGGQLSRMQVELGEPLGSLQGWTPGRTVIQWFLQR
ncbi:precorrin-6Y C5,15-methyltransferase (decarboxylating) subunit CbiT [Aestuariimicrobium sp. p3-SID1156]|uniref:precorrin-6Y C5,15-methyltransferase (decarboxylating) subunit CbiT n=1 Tax=Aestuariimicrobium sp. p3-SID1156 TaxID=2916038 RepID=UPI00223B3089|nr:precorrin-6Y C5,15-methyltransferase (decarboxylating) subunit CbiT [Aestuariimicrobium sp. p3-SID1156]MCT1458619.1 precorrin-6Y C5,15-methyltransferase (decarboxylating) subunit CbiT [Aestuariimicrobium sp. p3-SID1156]